MSSLLTLLTSKETIDAIKEQNPDLAYLEDTELKEALGHDNVVKKVAEYMRSKDTRPLDVKVKEFALNSSVIHVVRTELKNAGHPKESAIRDALIKTEVVKAVRAKLVDPGFSRDADMAIHYSNLRFTVFTVSVAVAGGLFFVALDKADFLEQKGVAGWFSGGAFLLTLCFTVMQWRISQSIVHYQRSAQGTSVSIPKGQPFWEVAARANTLAPYLFALFLWGSYWYNNGFHLKPSTQPADKAQGSIEREGTTEGSTAFHAQ